MHWEYADAIGQLDVALSHLDRAELDAPRLARTRAAVLERRGAARAALQDWPTARADYEAALALRPSEDHRVRARLFIRVAHASRLERERGGTEAALTRALGELEQVAERDRAWWQLRIEVRLQQADATCITDLPLWTPEVCSELAEVIELHGSSLQEAKYHLALADTELYAARWAVTDSCLAEARRAVECALRTDSIYLQSLTIAVLGSTLVFAGQYGEATVRLRQALGLAERCGDTIGVRAATMFLSIGARLSGDLRSTELHAAALRTLESEDASMPEFECSALGQLAWVALRRGEEDVARRLSEEAVGLWERDPSMSQSVWMMAWPATSCALADDDVARAFEYATLMTRPDQQVLAEGMEARLAEAVSHYSAGETEVAVEMINKLEIEARRLCYA
jgi:tetratricopeptide (TPR) repeat protein